MTYREQYYAIIDFRRKNPLPEGEYGENHHIVPKSLGGNDRKENIVKLTPEEHYRCHCILPYMYLEEGDKNGYYKMLCAWNIFTGKERENHKDMVVPVNLDRESEEYGRLKREYAKLNSETKKGYVISEESRRKLSESLKGNQNAKGHVHSEETRRKMSKALKGRVLSEDHKRKMRERVVSEETRRKISKANKGKPSAMKGCHLSEETKQKISESHKGSVHSEETKRKISEYQKGHFVSEDQKRKTSESVKRYYAMKKAGLGEVINQMPCFKSPKVE